MRSVSRATLFALVAALFIPADAHAADSAKTPEWVLPAGQEDAIEQFVLPLAMGHPVGATGWSLDSISIERDRIRLGFVKEGSKTGATIALLHPENAPDAMDAGAVRLAPDPNATPELIAAVRAVFVAHPAGRTPWVQRFEADSVRPSPVSGESGSTLRPMMAARTPLVPICFAMFVALIASTAGLLASKLRLPHVNWIGVAGLASLSAAGLLLRIRLSPHTFLHENYHAAEFIDFYLFNGSGIEFYGPAGPAIYRFANTVFGGTEQAVFSTNLALAALTVPSLALLDLTIFGSWRRALLTAIVLCLAPAHIRFSASEDLCIPAVLFAIWGLAALADYSRNRSLPALLAATLGIALAIESRPEMVLLPLVAIALILGLREGRTLVSLSTISVATALAGLWTYRVLAIAKVRHLGSADGPALMHGLPDWRLISFLDSVWTPRILWLLVMLGGLELAGRKKWALLGWVAGSALLFIAFPLALFRYPAPSSLHTQMFSLPLLAMLAGGATSLIADRRRVALDSAMIIMLVMGLASRANVVQALADQQQEWAFLREAVKQLPPDGELLTRTGEDPETHTEQGAMDVFPRFLLRERDAHYTLRDIDAAQRTGHWPDPHPGLLYYEGMYCYFDTNSRCRDVRNRYELKPVVTTTISGPGYSQLRYAPPPYQIGFYEVVNRKDR